MCDGPCMTQLCVLYWTELNSVVHTRARRMDQGSSCSSNRDVSRARYDHFLFAKERCCDLKGRRRMLELGAMSVVEAAIESVSLDAERHKNRSEQRYESCLETLLEGHYYNLCELKDVL